MSSCEGTGNRMLMTGCAIPSTPRKEDGYSSSWRREWDGRRYHTREHLTRDHGPLDPSVYTRAVEHDSHCIGSARLRVDPGQHCATYSVGLFVAGLRGRGLGREITGLVLSWPSACWVCTA
jgi:hypothetical protein